MWDLMTTENIYGFTDPSYIKMNEEYGFGYGLAFHSINPVGRTTGGSATLEGDFVNFCPTGPDDFFCYTIPQAQVHWEIPLFAVFCYTVMMLVGPSLVKTPIKPRFAKAAWNLSLCIFSWMGLYNVLPTIFYSHDYLNGEPAGLINGGLYSSLCTDASHFGGGSTGLWVFLFIISKIPELIDTFWLILGKNNIIFLHWYHHISVLLYCWHAYSERASYGLYFCAMNYLAHGVMYAYYAATQISPTTKKMVKPFAIFVTLVQLSQMGVGIFLVTVTGVYKWGMGLECGVTYQNHLFALIMYVTYFLLFAQLFYARYDLFEKVFGSNKAKKKKS